MARASYAPLATGPRLLSLQIEKLTHSQLTSPECKALLVNVAGDAVPKCLAANQFVPDTSTQCTKYWQCLSPGQGAYLSCGSGLAFDAGCTCCNYPSAFTCSGSSGSPSAPPTPDASPTSPPSPTATTPPSPPSGQSFQTTATGS